MLDASYWKWIQNAPDRAKMLQDINLLLEIRGGRNPVERKIEEFVSPQLGDASVLKGWRTKDISKSDNWNGCEKMARRIQKEIGGDIKRIKPTQTKYLGGYKGGKDSYTQPGWGHHEVVVKDGRVYDAFTGDKGMSISDYKNQWEGKETINFGF